MSAPDFWRTYVDGPPPGWEISEARAAELAAMEMREAYGLPHDEFCCWIEIKEDQWAAKAAQREEAKTAPAPLPAALPTALVTVRKRVAKPKAEPVPAKRKRGRPPKVKG